VPAELRADAHELVIAFVMGIVRPLDLSPVHDAGGESHVVRRAFGRSLGSPFGALAASFPVIRSSLGLLLGHRQPSTSYRAES